MLGQKHRLNAFMYLYYFLAAVSCWFGLQSLLGGFRFVAYVRREMSRPSNDYSPFVSILAPGRGLEDGLEENIRVLLTQEYPAYEILFIFDRDEDPAIELIKRLSQSLPNIPARIVIAGPSSDRGQKVHNLSVAVDEVNANSEVLVFVDTDARPDRRWLRQLVAPLVDPMLGASTGYRWFVPLKGGFASRLRSVWNASIASALGADRSKNFCWGGSTAIRRETFERIKIKERWRGTVSDDFLITTVMKENRLPVHFTPQCLVASVGDCDLSELFEFTTRQIKITRVYASQLWLPLLLGSSLFCLVFFGGLILLAVRIALGFSWLVLAFVLLLIFLLGAVKAYIRLRVVLLPLKPYEREVTRDLPAHVMLWPVASLLYLINTITAGFSRVINWRGITYELKSPTEAVIISRNQT